MPNSYTRDGIFNPHLILIFWYLVFFSDHLIHTEAKPYHSEENDWLQRKVESILKLSKQREVNNVLKRISQTNSGGEDDDFSIIQAVNQPEEIQRYSTILKV